MSAASEPADLVAAARRARLRLERARLHPATASAPRRPGRVHRVDRRIAAPLGCEPALAIGLIALVLGAVVGADLLGLVANCPSYRDSFLYDAFAPSAHGFEAEAMAWALLTAWMTIASAIAASGASALRHRLAALRTARRPLDPVRRWLADLAHGLRHLPPHERRAVLRELGEHLAETHERQPFADVAAIEARFGDARRLARAIGRAKAVRPRALSATRGEAAGWIGVGVACLWHVALAIELGVSMHGGTGGRRVWWEDVVDRSPAARNALHDVLREIGDGLATGRPLAWMIALWAAFGVVATAAGLALLRRRAATAVPRRAQA